LLQLLAGGGIGVRRPDGLRNQMERVLIGYPVVRLQAGNNRVECGGIRGQVTDPGQPQQQDARGWATQSRQPSPESRVDAVQAHGIPVQFEPANGRQVKA
jgi:hypothetical protein